MAIKTDNLDTEVRKSSNLEDERKRAMMMGQFSFIGESDKEVLDDSSILVECVQEWKSANRDERKRVRIQYEAAESSTGEDSPPLRRTKGYKSINLPKPSDSYAVVWVTSKGHVVIDRDVVLLSMSDVIGAKEDHLEMAGPRGSKFGFIPGDGEEGESAFDSDLYWSVGFLYKHFKSCGLMKWDKQMAVVRREIKAKTMKDGAGESRGKRKGSKSVKGKYEGKLIGWKGTYGFVQCTSGDFNGKTIFLHHSDISSPYLRLSRGLEMRFDVVRDEEDGQKLRAVNVHLCICQFSCAVHETETSSQQKPQPRRRRRSSKSSTKHDSSGEAAGRSSSDGGSPGSADAPTTSEGGGGEKRMRGNRRRQFNRKQRKSEVDDVIENDMTAPR